MNDTYNASTNKPATRESSPLGLVALMIAGLFGASYFVRSDTAPAGAFGGPLAGGATGAVVDVMPEAFRKHLPWKPDGKGVVSAGNGLQYIVLKEGPQGGKSPVATDRVLVNYEGRVPTGEKFDSSFDRGTPARFRLNEVIPGWTTGLQLMSEGDAFLFYIPSALAYGEFPPPGVIKPGDDLVFLVELLEVEVPKTADAAAWQTYTPWNPDAPGVVKTASGLQYVVLASGDPAGKPPASGQVVLLHYEARLAESGTVLGSSFARGDPEPFPTDGVFPGWSEALALMKPGDRWMLYFPASIAYGEEGTPGGPIPPNAALQFEVELLSVMQ